MACEADLQRPDHSESSTCGVAIIAEDAVRERLEQHLCASKRPIRVELSVSEGPLGLAGRETGRVDVILADPHCCGGYEVEWLAAVRGCFPEAAVVVLAKGYDESAVAAGADASLDLNNASGEAVSATLQQALAMRQARRHCEQLGEEAQKLREELALSRAALVEEAERRGRLEELFQAHRADYFAILDSARAMIWYIDKCGTILRANRRAAESAGMSISKLIGKNYYALYSRRHGITAAEDEAIVRSRRAVCGIVVRVETADGAVQWLCMDRIPRGEQGEGGGMTIFAADITEARIAEDQLKAAKEQIERINAQLRTAAEQAQGYAEEAIAANRVKSHFLANVTHELRTPMNAIIGYSDLLAEERLSGEQRKYLGIIQKAAGNLLELIDDVLDFSKIEAGRMDVRVRDCDPREILREVCDLMGHTAESKGLRFELETGDLPPALRTDGDRLRQCVMNLVGNALKFTDVGSVRICAGVFGTGEDALLRIDVRDSGIGIAADKQGQIFECFAQADANVSLARGGTGLGLAITRRLMELLGGRVEVVSELGKGSTFSLILPVNGPDAVTDHVVGGGSAAFTGGLS